MKETSRIQPRWAGLLLLAMLPLATGTAAWAAPYRPSSDSIVLERLPLRASRQAGQTLQALRSDSARNPADAQAAARLADFYFDTALATGDPRYTGYARAVVDRFADPLPVELLLVRGYLQQYQHGFEAALADFAAALRLQPDLAQAHAWRGAILLVQARYPEADIECKALQRLGRAALAGACLGLRQAYTGQLAAAELTLKAALAASTEAASRQWLLTRLGEVAAWRDQSARAEDYYRQALALDRDDVYLLAAWSDFLLDRSRFEEVERLLQRFENADPLLLRLALAQSALKRPQAARSIQVLADRFAAARLRGDTTHRAEESRFERELRGDAAKALVLAVSNYSVQREPRDARVLLEAALAAADPAAGAPARQWLAGSGFEDPVLRRLAALTDKPGRP
jgi:tetratricopeptide (TPR) repeat protein